jgi:ribosomal protein L40E/ribosomal protein L37AE/L43A
MVICSNCGTENPLNAKFCEECGNKLETSDNKRICPQCGHINPVDAKYCLDCGVKLSSEDEINDKPDCPVCKTGSLNSSVHKGALGLGTKRIFKCDKCGAEFETKGDKYKLTHILNTNNETWRKYHGQTLTTEEWARIAGGGVSDAEQNKIDQIKKQNELKEVEAAKKRDVNEFINGLQKGSAKINSNEQSPIILKRNEQTTLIMHNITLREPRAVRQTVGGYGGPTFRVAKGVSFRLGGVAARSESHEELRNIDRGTLVLTTRRLIFIGSKRTTNIYLNKIVAIEPYKDGIGSQRENKQKTEYFIGSNKTTLTINKNGRRTTIPVNGVVLKAAIMGNIA